MVSSITSSTMNDGSYSWSIPSNQDSGTNYRIMIIDTSDSSVFDFSDYFELYEPSITITSPVSTSTWKVGTSQSISWVAQNVGNYVSIDLYDGSTWDSTIISSTQNDGSYFWSIPSNINSGTNYQIKVTDSSDSSVCDYCDFQ